MPRRQRPRTGVTGTYNATTLSARHGTALYCPAWRPGKGPNVRRSRWQVAGRCVGGQGGRGVGGVCGVGCVGAAGWAVWGGAGVCSKQVRKEGWYGIMLGELCKGRNANVTNPIVRQVKIAFNRALSSVPARSEPTRYCKAYQQFQRAAPCGYGRALNNGMRRKRARKVCGNSRRLEQPWNSFFFPKTRTSGNSWQAGRKRLTRYGRRLGAKVE